MDTYAHRQFRAKAALIKATILSFLAASLIAGCGGTSGLQPPPAGGLTVVPITTPLSTPTPVATPSPTTTPTTSPTATPTPIATVGPTATPTPMPTARAPLTLRSNGALPDGNVGKIYGGLLGCVYEGPGRGYEVYGLGLGLSGGVPPYTWNWAAAPGSSLPTGLNVGFIHWGGSACGFPHSLFGMSGKPTTAGTYNVIVTVADSESPPMQATASYSILINP